VIAFGPLAGTWLAAALPDGLGGVGEAIGGLASLQAATLPLAAGLFGMVSTAGALTLVPVVPLVEMALATGLAGAIVAPAWPSAGDALLVCASGVTAAAVRVATFVASLPGAAFPVDAMPAWAVAAWAALLAGLWAGWPQPRRRWKVRLAAGIAGVCLLLVVLGPPIRPGSAICVLDVGQGDAILVRDGESAMLVDTGPDATVMRRALARAGVRDLSCVVLTHAHADHTAGSRGWPVWLVWAGSAGRTWKTRRRSRAPARPRPRCPATIGRRCTPA
jgi:competence protein ComEC